MKYFRLIPIFVVALIAGLIWNLTKKSFDPYCLDCMVEITRSTETLVDTRPNHPGQLNLDEIYVGDILHSVNTLYTEDIVVTRAPYKENGDCKVQYIRANREFIYTAFCSDWGLIPYEHGWNPTNHVTKASAFVFSEAYIQTLLKNRAHAH